MGLFNGNKFDFQSAVGKIQNKVTDAAQQMSAKTNSQGSALNQGKNENIFFCSNCGAKLNNGAKFCHECGATVENGYSRNTKGSRVASSQQNYSERQQEYVGRILKCPNCGANITETTAVCPECGMRITGKTAVSSVQAFKEQLMEIENSKRGGLGSIIGAYIPASKSYEQKLSLIKNFPIPNSIDDCLEFIMLAIANIDVGLSKNTLANKLSDNNQLEKKVKRERNISNAWVAKMEQVYKKAEILFPNDPAFAGIQKMYYEKMKELKIKIK